MNVNAGQFYDGSQSYTEADDGHGRRLIPRDDWIKTLPASWKTHAYLEKETHLKESISYFANLKKGFKNNCFQLRRYADDRKENPSTRFISTINDEEYDCLLSAMGNVQVKFPFLCRVETLRSDLDTLINECLEEKKRAITICENIAEIEGKPNEILLKAWFQLPNESKNFIIENKRQNPSERLPEGLLTLTETICKLRDENIALKGDLENVCKKDIKIQLENEAVTEEMKNLQIQLSNVEARFHSKQTARVQSLTNQIARLQKALDDLQQQYFEDNLSYTKKVKELQQDKESLLTRLSEVAGSKLTTNNPAITDLSDRYRPMKLSEMFSEVYDDNWTDAVEELSSEGIEEKTVVILLRDMVMTAFRLCKESHTILIEMPECKLFEKIDRSDKERGEMPQLLDIELEKEEKEELRKCTNAFKRSHHQAFIKSCQKRFIHMALEMVEHAKQPETESVAEVYERPEMIATHFESQKIKFDFTKPLYKKGPLDLENHTEKPSSPKKQKTLLFNSLDIGQQDNKETENDRKTQSARADFAKPRQQTDLCSEPLQPNIKQNTEQDSGIKLKQAVERTWESDRLPKVLGFVKRIVELCWWMQAIQPQVHLDCSIPTDGNFSHDHYKAYMKSGSKIDYIVWPVMFLHENGPLLSKGVAQPL